MFTFITNFLAARRAAAQAQKDADTRRLAQQIAAASAKIDAETTAMTRAPCPINKNRRCFTDCAHFATGHVAVVKDGEYTLNFSRSPACRLWNTH
jgi:hypothetical protein